MDGYTQSELAELSLNNTNFPVYQSCEETFFLERVNRFVMLLQRKNGEKFRAHIPNTGRMEEFCFEKQPFFVTPQRTAKYSYKVVATRYEGHLIFLDTLKANELFFQLLVRNRIPQFQAVTHIQREVTFGDSRFDFTFVHNRQQIIAEIKSCTLCHNSLAMFPDAPTLRGQKHLNRLEQLADGQQIVSYVIFLVLNSSAERFVPNFHTDFEYGKRFLAANNVQFRAYKLDFIDPVTVNLASLQTVPIDFAAVRTHCQNRGSYLLVLENPEDRVLSVGKLGEIFFQRGWYVYVGSAMQGLDSRLQRHQRKRKKQHWHIDYIASTMMKVKKVYPIRKIDRIESELARAVGNISGSRIKGFGASDVPEDSHLFYFHTTPLKSRAFIKEILNARHSVNGKNVIFV